MIQDNCSIGSSKIEYNLLIGSTQLQEQEPSDSFDHPVFHKELIQIKKFFNKNHEFIEDVVQVSKTLDEMQQLHQVILSSADQIQSSFDSLYENQSYSQKLVDGIEKNLSFFSDYDDVFRLLQSPGDTICLHPMFIPYLKRMDECIKFMNNHVNWII